MIKAASIVIPYMQKNKFIHLWVQKRESDDELNGLLEFPGGKVEKGEKPNMAATREVLEETGVKLVGDELEFFNQYEVSIKAEVTLILRVYLCNDLEGKFSQSGYLQLSELETKADKIPPKNAQIIGDVKKYLFEKSMFSNT